MTPEPQSTRSVLLVRPAAFGFHAEAAQSNAFASRSENPELASAVLREFDGLAQRLSAAGVEVHVLDDRPDPPKPDAVFPNNWVSFHGDGTMVLYPMATDARRLERDSAAVGELLDAAGFDLRQVLDLSFHEDDGRFLEGTGSLVLDRPRRRAYANLSPRTDAAAIADFGARLGYSTFVFDARDRRGRPIYHTNVLLSLGTEFALLCSDAVAAEHRAALVGEIEATGRTLIAVDYEQMRQFACNLIELRGRGGEPVIASSQAARASFRADQLRLLESFGLLIDAPIPMIEAVGGGGVRCMIAEIHLPRISQAL